jgi:hypothetical protein
MHQEVYTEVDEYDGYAVSDIGNVKNVTSGRILKPGKNSHGYLYVNLCKNGKKKSVTVHKLVAAAYLFPAEEPDQVFVDRIDGDRTNNHVDNLRWASRLENNRNATKRSNTSSKYKGVCIDKRCNKWQVSIYINSKHVHLGYFKNEKDAASKYNEKASEHFGAFAKINEISVSSRKRR